MASASPTGSEPDQVELPPAAAPPPPAQTEQEKQEEVRKRIELISGLESTLNTSVLQLCDFFQNVANVRKIRY